MGVVGIELWRRARGMRSVRDAFDALGAARSTTACSEASLSTPVSYVASERRTARASAMAANGVSSATSYGRASEEDRGEEKSGAHREAHGGPGEA